MLSFGLPPTFTNQSRQAIHVLTTKLCHSGLRTAISQGHILDVGCSVRLGREGKLCTPLLESFSANPRWDAAIKLAVKMYREKLEESIHSIYLRGSVAAGHAFTDGRSDLDFVIITHSKVRCPNLSAEMHALFPFIRRIDVSSHNLASPVPPALRFILMAYCAHLYGPDLRRMFGCDVPSPESLESVRNDERTVIDAIDARSWFLKKALRGIVDCLARDSLEHARDIVPCTRIIGRMRPSVAPLAVRAAIAACNETEVDEDLVRDMADWAEIELFTFKHGSNYSSETQLAPPVSMQKSKRNLNRVIEDASIVVRGALSSHQQSHRPFVRDALDPVLPGAFNFVEEAYGLDVSSAFAHQVHQNAPIVYRNAVSQSVPLLGDTESLCDILCTEWLPADVRLGSGTQFTFCKRSYTYHDRFEPPTIVRRMLPREFIARCRGDLDPVFYENERVYLQSEVDPKMKLFPETPLTTICQAERWWICTSGVVSPLHYDAAYSALLLLTGTKRMILFPPSALELMRVYPKDHPLHRRAMVDLYRPQATMFREFWQHVCHLGQEVTLKPGDVLMFPPFWAHHTESSAEGGLCAARTQRFLFRDC